MRFVRPSSHSSRSHSCFFLSLQAPNCSLAGATPSVSRFDTCKTVRVLQEHSLIAVKSAHKIKRTSRTLAAKWVSNEAERELLTHSGWPSPGLIVSVGAPGTPTSFLRWGSPFNHNARRAGTPKPKTSAVKVALYFRRVISIYFLALCMVISSPVTTSPINTRLHGNCCWGCPRPPCMST